MICILNESRDPYYNLAFEEYILKYFKADEDILILWRNKNTIVIGRHQNTIEEINQEKVKAYGVNVVRRMSGGGAVYHDDGNVNFTFITNSDPNAVNNYQKFLAPVIEVLNDMGIPAEFSGRNDVVIEGKKISGNAQYYHKDRMFHHGTILFDVDTSILGEVLNVDQLKIQSKAVKSVRSRVTNIKPYLKEAMSTEDFMEKLKSKLLKDGKELTVDDKVKNEVRALADSKYSTWEWIYGESPKFDMMKKKKYEGGILDIRLNVEKGKIVDIMIYGDFLSCRPIEEHYHAFIGINFREEDIMRVLNQIDIKDYFGSITKAEIIDCMLY